MSSSLASWGCRKQRERQLVSKHSILRHRLAMKQEIAEHLAVLRDRRDGTLPEMIIREFKVEARGQDHAGVEVLLKFENVLVEGAGESAPQ